MVAVAQLVRALDCGSRGRGFESPQPPSTNPHESRFHVGFLFGLVFNIYLQSFTVVVLSLIDYLNRDQAPPFSCSFENGRRAVEAGWLAPIRGHS